MLHVAETGKTEAGDFFTKMINSSVGYHMLETKKTYTFQFIQCGNPVNLREGS